MEHFMQWLLENSLKAGVLALLVCGIQLAFGRHMSARWKYLLWALVALRLVMPSVFPADFSVFNLWHGAELREVSSAPIQHVAPGKIALPSGATAAPSWRPHVPISPWTLAFAIWLGDRKSVV